MSEGEILVVMKEAVLTALKISSPMLVISIVVGLIVAIFQAATQIHEQTLTFVPKLLVLAIMMLAMGSWMGSTMADFTNYIFGLIATL